MITNVVMVAAALAAGFSGLALVRRVPAFTDGLDRYGVPRSWWPWLAAAKLAGAAGMIAGLWIPYLGLVTAVCLSAYFIGAALTVLRSGVYAHLPIPVIYATPAVVAAVLLAS